MWNILKGLFTLFAIFDVGLLIGGIYCATQQQCGGDWIFGMIGFGSVNMVCIAFGLTIVYLLRHKDKLHGKLLICIGLCQFILLWAFTIPASYCVLNASKCLANSAVGLFCAALGSFMALCLTSIMSVEIKMQTGKFIILE